MSTLRQIEANRRNAQKSTGPTSVTGKAVSSMNSLKTGIHAKSLVLPSENLADLEQLIDECYHRHHPRLPEARTFLDDLIYCEWTLRRLRAAETQMWQYQNDDKFRDPEKYPLGHSATSYPGLLLQTPVPPRCHPPRPPPRPPGPQTTPGRSCLRPHRRTRPASAPSPVSTPPSPQATSPKLASFQQPPSPPPPQLAPAPPSSGPHLPVTGERFDSSPTFLSPTTTGQCG